MSSGSALTRVTAEAGFHQYSATAGPVGQNRAPWGRGRVTYLEAAKTKFLKNAGW
jgi:hypothetical protein